MTAVGHAATVRLLISFFLLVSALNVARAIAAVLLSAPFDNFRMECPRGAGAQRLAIRMVESQGLKRQDAVYTLTCSHINELYGPSPAGELEREDCRYGTVFDPILASEANATCDHREYIAGVVRLADTRIQMECCRMRGRDERGCFKAVFPRPFGADSRTEIEFGTKLINSFSIRNHQLIVRFCDLAPRIYDEIVADVRTTKATTRTSSITTIASTTTTTATTIEEATTTTAEPEEFTEALKPKRVIKVAHKSALSRKANWATTTVPTVTGSTASGSTLADDVKTDITAIAIVTNMIPSETTISPIASDNKIVAFKDPIVATTVANERLAVADTTALGTTTEKATVSRQSSSATVASTTAESKSVTVTDNVNNSDEINNKTNDINGNNETQSTTVLTTIVMPHTTMTTNFETTKMTTTTATENVDTTTTATNNPTTTTIQSKTNNQDTNQEQRQQESHEKDEQQIVEETVMPDESTMTTVTDEEEIMETTEKTTTTDTTNATTTETTAEKVIPTTRSEGAERRERVNAAPPMRRRVAADSSDADLLEETLRELNAVDAAAAVQYDDEQPETVKTDEKITVKSAVVKSSGYSSLSADGLEKVYSRPPSRQKSAKTFGRSLTIALTTVSPTTMTLAPFDAFPSPPPRGSAMRPRTLARHLDASPSAVTAATNSRQFLDSDDNNNVENDITVVTAVRPTAAISIRFPPTTRTPYHRRKLLTTPYDSAADDGEDHESYPNQNKFHASRHIAVSTAGPLSSRTRRPSVEASASGLPYVDEETDGSPFDDASPIAGGVPRRLQTRRREEAVLAAAADAEIAFYEARLRPQSKHQSRVKPAQEPVEEPNVQERSRFEPAGARFDRHGPFEEASAEIRRAPAHHDTDHSLDDIRQQILDRQLARRERKKLRAAIAKSIDSPPSTVVGKQSEDVPMAAEMSRRDGVRQFTPAENRAVQMPDIIIYDTVDAKNLPWAVKEAHKKRRPAENVMVNDLVAMNDSSDDDSASTTTVTDVPEQQQQQQQQQQLNEEELQELQRQQQIDEELLKQQEKEQQDNYERQLLELQNEINEQRKQQRKQQQMEKQQTEEQQDEKQQIVEQQQRRQNEEINIESAVDVTTSTVMSNSDIEDYGSLLTTSKITKDNKSRYGPAQFYFVPIRKSSVLPEKVLTFCSKATAVRDAAGLILACGGDDGPWQPNRCPPSSACLLAPDATYRICCPTH